MDMKYLGVLIGVTPAAGEYAACNVLFPKVRNKVSPENSCADAEVKGELACGFCRKRKNTTGATEGEGSLNSTAK